MNLAAPVLLAVDELRRIGESALKEPNLLTADNLAFMYETNWEKFPATLQAIEQQLPSPMRRVLPQQKKGTFPAFDETLSALQTGDPEPFFTHLQWFPPLLQHEQIFPLTVASWWRQKTLKTPEGEKARAYLRKIGSVLADSKGAPELPEQEWEQHTRENNKKAKKRYDDKAKEDRTALQKAFEKHVEDSVRLLKKGQVRTTLAAQAQQLYDSARKSKKARSTRRQMTLRRG